MKRSFSAFVALAALPSLSLVAAGAVGAVGALGALEGCKSPMAKIEAMRDGLLADDAAKIQSAMADLPSCADAPPFAALPGKPGPNEKGCLSDIANALGSQKGFVAPPPDQAANATVAVILVRDGRGDHVAHVDLWLSALKAGKSTGADVLRLAVARKMAEAAPIVGKKIEDEKDALAAMKAVAGAVPGACSTYWLLGSGSDPKKLPPELTAEHSACVQKDLSRREGPGASYGEGTFRALEGALSAWRETERALRLGLSHAAPSTKSVIDGKLTTIEAGTQRIATKKMEMVPAQTLQFIGDVHADAGVVLFKAKDAGADAATEAGAGAAAPGVVPGAAGRDAGH